jgi:eukaryotic-like serine/threonine-protein kinase
MRAGDLIAQRFELRRPAGRGGMGEVWQASDVIDGTPLAVKFVADVAPEHGERFLREGRVLASLRHPAIVRYVAHGLSEAGLAFLVMEWLDGQSLSERLAAGPMCAADAIALGRDIAEALGAAHAMGIVHRDVKPSNVFLVGGATPRAKLLDFGVAILGSTPTVTRTGAIVGTPAFMSPEQVRRADRVDSRADVFSLGCLLFRALTGRNPFVADDVGALLAKILFEQAPPMRELSDGIPEPLEQLIARMLAKDPARRPRDGSAAAAALANVGPLETHAQPHAAPVMSLGASEQRIVSVVLWSAASNASRGESVSAMTVTSEGQADRTMADALAAAVARFEARVEVLANGNVVALFEGGQPRDQALRAATLALALRNATPESAAALATGRVVFGGLAPVGEAIERAAHLLRAGDGVWVDDVTAGLLDRRFDVGRISDGALLLRGDVEARDGPRSSAGEPSPFCGRDRELGYLEAVFAQCRAEKVARAILVTAPAGAGKSRLRSELLARLRASGEHVEVLMGQGDPVGTGDAFGLFALALRRYAGVAGGEPPENARRKLRDRVARAVGETDATRVAQFLGEMVCVPFPADDSPTLRAARADVVLRGDQMRSAAEDLFDAECSAHPVILVLEDLHWGDRATVELVDRLLRNLRERPFMVLALARPEVHGLFPALWSERDCDEMRLPRLTRAPSEALARAMLGAGCDDAMVKRLVDRADGNPLCLEELGRAVSEGRSDSLPTTVVASLQARLENLDASARRVLRAASVFGAAFWRNGVRALLGGDDPNEWLELLERSEVIARRAQSRFAGETEYTFRHELLREVAYSMLTRPDLSLAHGLAGRWLEGVGETSAITLAEHFGHGGQNVSAVQWYLQAAEHALAGNDLAAAIERAERGAALGAAGEDLGALRVIQAGAHRWRGEWEIAELRATEAHRVLRRGSVRWYVAIAEAAAAAFPLGHGDLLTQLAADLRSPARDPDAERARLTAGGRLGWLLLAGGHAELAATLVDELAHSPEAENPGVAARLFQYRALRAIVSGDPAQCVELNAAASELFRRASNSREACGTRLNVGFALMSVGEYADAVEVLRDAVAEASHMGLVDAVAMGKHNLGLACARLGSLQEARSLEREAIEAYARQNNPRMEGGSRIYMSEILLSSGDPHGAETEARRAADVLSTIPQLRCVAQAALAQSLLALGRDVEGLAAATEASAQIRELGCVEESESGIRLCWAEALHAVGRSDEARAAVGAAKERLLEQAGRITRDGWRKSFLERVPENARILALATAWNRD